MACHLFSVKRLHESMQMLVVKLIWNVDMWLFIHGPLTRYVKLWVAHAPEMPPTSKETASSRSRHASRHVRDARAVMHVGIVNPRWLGKRSRHSRRMRNTLFCISGKRPMTQPLQNYSGNNQLRTKYSINFSSRNHNLEGSLISFVTFIAISNNQKIFASKR